MYWHVVSAGCSATVVLRSAAGRITLRNVTTVSLKLPDDLLRDVETEARRRGVSKSAVIRDELAARLRRTRPRRARVTCADLAGDLIGSVTGPIDLSTNPRYLDEAIRKDAQRGRGRHRRHR